MSLKAQGLGLCPLREPVLSQPMTQIHSAASLGPRGSGWQCLEKASARGCLVYGCKCVCVLEEERPSPRVGTPQRPEAWEVCWASQSNHLVVQVGKLRPGRKGLAQGPPASRRLEPRRRPGKWGTWASAPALLHPRKLLQPFWKRERQSWWL